MIIYLSTNKALHQFYYHHYFYDSSSKRYINALSVELKLDNTLCLCVYIDDGDTFTQSFSNINEKIIIFTEDNIDIPFLENILLDKIISTI